MSTSKFLDLQIREWHPWQKQKIAIKFGTAREKTIAGKIVEINTMGRECVTYTLHRVFLNSAFVHSNVE